MRRFIFLAIFFSSLIFSMPLWLLSQESNFARDTSIINRLNYQASIAQRAREMEKAIELANRALDSSFLVGYQDGMANSLFVIGIANQRTSNPRKALQYYERAMLLSENNPKLLVDIIRNCGNSHNDLGNYDSAIVFFNRLLDIASQHEMETEISRAYNNLGISYDSKGDLLLALDFYFKSLEIKIKQNDQRGMSSTLNNIGVVFYNQGDVPRAIEYFLKSLKIKEELGDMASVANTYNNIGVICKEQGQYDEAIEYYEKSHEINSSIGDKRASAVSLVNHGMLLHEIGNSNKAIGKIKAALWINREIGAKQSEINALFSLGEIYLATGQLDSSRVFLLEAEKLSLETGDKRNLAHVRILLAKTYLSTSNHLEVIRNAASALKLATEANTLQSQRDAHQILADVNERIGMNNLSLHHYKNYISLRDSLSNNESSRRIYQMQLQAKFEKMLEAQRLKQEKEMAAAQLANQRQILISRSFLLFAILALIIAGFVFYHYRVSKKLTILLQNQKLETERQKEEILSHRDEIAHQRNLVMSQRDKIMDLFTEISESVMYAQRIQQALFPSKQQLNRILGEHFVFIRPKQVVSGDFYWVAESGDTIYIAMVDCTGHGMPGAFMSMLGTTLLNELILQQVNFTPNLMLDHLREKVISTLSQNGQTEDNMDGMDIAFITLNKNSLKITFAGANIPVWIIRDPRNLSIPPQLYELQPDRMPVSYHFTMKPFSMKPFSLQKGDMVYMFSDGYADQFGGKNGKKFQIKHFRSLLKSISHLTAKEQESILADNFAIWQGDNYQVDDVLVMGFRV